jgi:hypothetical protein
MQLALKLFFFPGDFIRSKLGITVEEDGGIFRSFINASVWGILSLMIALHYLT